MKTAKYNHNNMFNVDIKKVLINNLFSLIDVARYRYKILEKNKSDLNLLEINDYKLYVNYTGCYSYLVFWKIKDKRYSCIIDKKTLKYNIQSIDLNTVEITHFPYLVNDSLYNDQGTVLEGTYINKKNTFVINDVLYFQGAKMIELNLNDKIEQLRYYFTTNRNENNISNLNILINKIYDYKDILKLIFEDIPNINEYDISGLCLYPIKSGTKLIYNDTTLKYIHGIDKHALIQKIVENVNNDETILNHVLNYFGMSKTVSTETKKESNREIISKNFTKKKVTYIVKTIQPIYATFEMKKTDKIDVYKLFLIRKLKEAPFIKIQYIKIDIAYIPTIECSHMCNQFFETHESCIVRCQFLKDKMKWIPIEENHNRQYPDTFDSLNNQIEIVETYI
jgi:hypothetical protein